MKSLTTTPYFLNRPNKRKKWYWNPILFHLSVWNPRKFTQKGEGHGITSSSTSSSITEKTPWSRGMRIGRHGIESNTQMKKQWIERKNEEKKKNPLSRGRSRKTRVAWPEQKERKVKPINRETVYNPLRRRKEIGNREIGMDWEMG